jgi:hypothetical protein
MSRKNARYDPDQLKKPTLDTHRKAQLFYTNLRAIHKIRHDEGLTRDEIKNVFLATIREEKPDEDVTTRVHKYVEEVEDYVERVVGKETENANDRLSEAEPLNLLQDDSVASCNAATIDQLKQMEAFGHYLIALSFALRKRAALYDPLDSEANQCIFEALGELERDKRARWMKPRAPVVAANHGIQMIANNPAN